MLAYASRTGTRRNLEALRNAEWRLLVSAAGPLRHEGFPYALDNGAWSAYQQRRPFDEYLFLLALRKLGRNADWVTLPDIVAGGQASLELSLRWMRRVLDETALVLLAVQDGMSLSDVTGWVGPRVGLFVGGSTSWKEATMSQWGALGKTHKSWVHVGRVNSVRRINLCSSAGVTSFDGTSVTRFAKTLPRLDHARKQLALL